MGVRAITPGHGVCTWLHPMTREKGWQADIIPEMRPAHFEHCRFHNMKVRFLYH
jgi:hypothetical protein